MPAIPESTRSSIIMRLLDHAGTNWPQLAKVRARYHGSFAYITGVLRDGQQIPLFRLRYGGSAHSFGFAIYSAASSRYEDALLRTGLPTGTPQEALDTACTIHLADLEPLTPQTNLRAHPLKYLLDVGFTRDTWCHRIDICHATGRPMDLTPDHDGRLVADIVAEWAGLHGQPFDLELDGPAGGTFRQGRDGENVTLDALDYIRTLAGRLPGRGVLSYPLPL